MKRLFTTGIAAATLLLSCLSGCTKTEETFHYVNLSQVSCSFLGEGNQPLEITVKASPAAYEATPGATWVKATQSEDGKVLILTVDDNDTGAERSTTVTIAAGEALQTITVNQLPKDSAIARYRKLDTFQMGAAMSPSGKYAGGFTASIAPDDSWQYSPTIVDLETGEVYEFGPYPESLHYLHQTMAITDQGLLFISDGQNGGQIAIDLTGNLFIPEAPAGFTGKPEIQGTSADGKYWVGYGMKGKVGRSLHRARRCCGRTAFRLNFPGPTSTTVTKRCGTAAWPAASPQTAKSSTVPRGRTPTSACSTG